MEPRDPVLLGRLIEEYGEQLSRAADAPEGDAAVLALAWIDDPRVIPHFRRLFGLRSFAHKFIALHVLGKFATDEAFATLQSAMKTTAADVDATSRDQAKASATKIRLQAVSALQRTKHPKALEFLLTQRSDESESVRYAIVRAISSGADARAISALEELSRDRDERVRAEAVRSLASRRQTSAN